MHDIDRMTENLRLLVELARQDVHATRARGAGGEWIYKPATRALSDDDLKRHLKDGPHVGVYLMDPEAEVTRLACYDLDDHDGKAPWEQIRDAGLKIIEACRRFGLEPWPWRSGSGRGIHLWFRWDEAQEAKMVRQTLALALGIAGYKVGSSQKGVPGGEVDIFPKQDRTEEYGSLVAIPWGRASVPLTLELQDSDAPEAWISSAPMRTTAKEVAEPDGAGEDILRSALECVDSHDYQVWMECGLALKHKLGDAGYAVWNEWSKRASNYGGEKATRAEWNRFKPSGLITIGSVFYWARKGGWKPPVIDVPMFSDQWLSRRFVDTYHDALRYIDQLKLWRRWNGGAWTDDHTLHVMDMVLQFCGEQAKTARKNKMGISSAKTAMEVYKICRADQRIATASAEWNQNPMLVATPTSTIDLTSGEVRTARLGDYINKSTKVSIEHGDCPTWKAFLREVMEGDEEMVEFLQRCCGYFLSGLIDEDKVFFLYGRGGNGKSVLVDTVRYVLGSYGISVPMQLLISNNLVNEHPTAIASLEGARLAVSSESAEGQRLNTALVKNLSGGDILTARRMRQDYREFQQTHKLLMMSNHRPLIGRVDLALLRRFIIVPFNVSFVGREDKKLRAKLQDEAGRVLAWMVEGCLAWQQHGLMVPQKIEKESREYITSQDDMAIWLDDSTTQGPNYRQAAGELFDSWQEWCKRNGAFAGSHKVFGERLREHGFQAMKSDGYMIYKGLKLGRPGPQALSYPREDVALGEEDERLV